MLLNLIPITHQQNPESSINISRGVEKFNANSN